MDVTVADIAFKVLSKGVGKELHSLAKEVLKQIMLKEIERLKKDE